jgi:hypothetical protein
VEIQWRISPRDASTVRALVRSRRRDAFVRNRIRRNILGERPPLTRAMTWHLLTMCLLTTQQRSGPTSRVTAFLESRPYPLRFAVVSRHRDPQSCVVHELRRFGGIRRGTTIGAQLAKNLPFFVGPQWSELKSVLMSLPSSRGFIPERRAAEWLADRLAGLGPKQSRNLLQSLGLTRYEIPIDSRITRWLNDVGFPIHLNAAGLADLAYYSFVSDGVRELCKAARIYPCVLDAVVFSMGDGDGWEALKLRWA